MGNAEKEIELSVVMPCLNEVKTVGLCVAKAMNFMKYNDIHGEVIVADNGSADGSVEAAKNAGARVIGIKQKGYGSALMGGISKAKGKYVIMGDSDDSYDFSDLKKFVDQLRRGNDLVMGNRFKGEIKKGAMPWHHKYLGNPVLSGIGKLFFKSPVNDFHCGLRGFTLEAYKKMDMQTTGMEFASEMVVKATLMDLKISEVPITLSPDGREGKPHLRSFRDGWRHLRFLFLYTPRWLFLYPGLGMMFAGFLALMYIFLFPDISWDIHTMLYASGSIMIGFQAAILAVYSKVFAIHERLLPSSPKAEKVLKKYTPEKGIAISLILLVIGIVGFVYSIFIWQEGTFFELGIRITMRYVIASVTFLVLGFQLFFSSLFYFILKLNTR